MTMPSRIQRSRARGWRVPEGAIYVGRPTRWGNPFDLGVMHHAAAIALATYGDPAGPDAGQAALSGTGWVNSCHRLSAMFFREYVDCLPDGAREAWLAPLRGHDLACWCGLGQPCHADVLLELANG